MVEDFHTFIWGDNLESSYIYRKFFTGAIERADSKVRDLRRHLNAEERLEKAIAEERKLEKTVFYKYFKKDQIKRNREELLQERRTLNEWAVSHGI